MTITPIRTRQRGTSATRRPPVQRPISNLEYVAAVEAEIRANLAQAEAWPEHAEFFTAEANRLRDQLGGTSARKAA